jgi:O-antigen/teichoic acid export membrane protein
MSRIIIPIVTCAAIAAPELISTVYGSKWTPAALPMRLLTPGLILLGLRCGIGSIYYTKDHPSFDTLLHGARLVLIVLVVFGTSGFGLAAVSAGMSAVEGAISVAGQSMACMLIDLGLTALCEEAWPGLLLAAMCGIATILGRSVALALELQGPLLLALEVLPAALVFAWREADVFREMVGTAFSSREAAPAKLSQERV